MRISDWSSDVCSSDLVMAHPGQSLNQGGRMLARVALRVVVVVLAGTAILLPPTLVLAAGTLAVSGQLGDQAATGDRKSVVSGKSVSVRVDLGGRRIIKKKT